MPKAPKKNMVWQSKDGGGQKVSLRETKPDFIFKTKDAEREHIQRMVEATLWGVGRKEMVQDFLLGMDSLTLG